MPYDECHHEWKVSGRIAACDSETCDCSVAAKVCVKCGERACADADEAKEVRTMCGKEVV